MEGLKLYRKRIIPAECVYLKDDILLYRDSDVIVTKWYTLRPKKTLSLLMPVIWRTAQNLCAPI